MKFPKIEAALEDIKNLLTGKNTVSAAELQGVQAKVSALETTISGELTAANQTITDLKAAAETAKTANEKAITDLKAEHATALKTVEEKGKKDLTAALVAQGLDPAQIPTSAPENEQGNAAKTPYEQYCALLAAGKNQEAAKFYAVNSDKILAGKK